MFQGGLVQDGLCAQAACAGELGRCRPIASRGEGAGFCPCCRHGLLGGRFLRRRPGRDHYAAGQPVRKTDRAARDGRTLPAGRDCRMALDADRQTFGYGRRGRYRAQDLRLYPAGDRREFPQALRFRRLQAVEGGDGIQGRQLDFPQPVLCASDLSRLLHRTFGAGRGGRRNDRALETQGLCLCRRYDGVEDRLVCRCRGRCHHLEERPVANPFQPQFHRLERGVGRLRHGSEQLDADGGRGRSDQRGLRLFEAGGRPRRRARDLPDRLPHMAPGIPLCRGGLACGQ